jgi:FkbH-like protein
MNFSTLKKNLKKELINSKKIKIALLGDSATQFLHTAIKGYGVEFNYNLEIWESDFNQVEQQILNEDSELYDFQPDVVVIFHSSHKLLNKYNKLKPENQLHFSANELSNLTDYYNVLQSKGTFKVIVYNFNEIDDSVYGNYANKLQSSFLFQLRKLNLGLMELASEQPNLFIGDLSTIQNQIGKKDFFQPSIYVNTEMVLSIDVLPMVAKSTLDIINAFEGKVNKCVILDLDNTTWGGIIGDDGIENIQIGSLGIGKAFTEFQYWVKKLKNRGIIVAVCSKNTESIAKEPFESHPDMVLRLEDISVFVANWENKADNIRSIQEILNIGFDSMVFIDDNPFERNIVRDNIPGIHVPELPEDPAEYLEFLYSLNLFETISSSKEDAERTKLYQIESQRQLVSKKFTNETDFLKNLDMSSLVESFNKFNIPRVAQLSQRSNQFNLRTVRYTELEISNLSNQPDYFTFAFTLEDRFGDNGLICVIILKALNDKELFIDSWFMSCRVLKRGMENFVLNTLVEFAKANNFDVLKGEYINTPKNELVKDHYKNLGFIESENLWIQPINSYEIKETYIIKK